MKDLNDYPFWEKPVNKLTVLFIGLVNAFFIAQAGVSWSAGTIEFNVAKIEGASVTYTYKVDAAYAKKYQVAVPAPFEIQVPKAENVYVSTPPQTGGPYYKFSYATADKKLIENVQLVHMTIPLQDNQKKPLDTKQRLADLTKLLSTDAFAMAAKGFQNAKVLETRQEKINGLDVVVVDGQYVGTRFGPTYCKLVGYLNPNNADSVFVVASAVTSLSQIKSQADLKTKGYANTIIHSFHYETAK